MNVVRVFTLAAATTTALVLPAAAQAVDYTVSVGSGPCEGDDRACGTVALAEARAGNGDRIVIAPGSYDESVTFDQPGVQVIGSETAPGTRLNGTQTISAGGGTPVVLRRLIAVQTTSAAVNVTGTGVRMEDAGALSTGADAITITGGTLNALIRSLVLSGGATASGVRVGSAAGSGAKALQIDSSVISGGPNGAGVALDTAQPAAGDVSVTGRHVTIAGSPTAVSANANVIAGGDIASSFRDSIVLGAISAQPNPGALGTGIGATTATVDTNSSLRQADPATLFVNAAGRNFHLRTGASAAIDKGGAVGDGESERDVDGGARVVGPASDLGADEHDNQAPRAGTLTVSDAGPRAGRNVTFTVAGSSDPEASIAAYVWSFGDGTRQTTTGPSVTKTYANEGAVTATVAVIDAGSLVSPPSNGVTVTVKDGTPPLVGVDRPTKNQTVRLTRRTTRTVTVDGVRRRRTTTRRNRIRFEGRALDRSGMRSVVLSLRQVSRLPTRRRSTSGDRRRSTTQRRGSSSQTRRCRWVRPSRGIVSRSCSNPVLITAKLGSDGGRWTYTLPSRLRLARGTYRVTVAGVDRTGAFGNSNPSSSVTFRLR